MTLHEQYLGIMENLQKDIVNHIETVNKFSGKTMEDLSEKEKMQFLWMNKLRELNKLWVE